KRAKSHFRFITVAWCDDPEDPRARKGHQDGGSGMHAACISKHIDCKSEYQCSNQDKPFRGFNRQQENKQHINIRVYITAPLHMVEHHYLEHYQENETQQVLNYFNDHVSEVLPARAVLPSEDWLRY